MSDDFMLGQSLASSQASLLSSQASTFGPTGDDHLAQRRMRKRSLGRRVSFASTARMRCAAVLSLALAAALNLADHQALLPRTFEKDNVAFSPIASMENESVGSADTLEDGGLKMPDLSTVRKTSDASFEVAIKGASPEPEEKVRPTPPRRKSLNRRDSVAGLFEDSGQAEPNFCGQLESDDSDGAQDDPDPSPAPKGTAATKDKEIRRDSVANLFGRDDEEQEDGDDMEMDDESSGPAPPPGRQYRSRDSVAAFFHDDTAALPEPMADATVVDSEVPVESTPSKSRPSRRPRDSVAPFFDQSLLESPRVEDARSAIRSSRDSVANLFPDSIPDSPAVPTDQRGAEKQRQRRPRDSVANFFQDGVSESPTQPSHGRAVGTRKSPRRTRDSVAPFFTQDAMDSPTAAPAPESRTTRRPRDSVAGLFSSSDDVDEDVNEAREGPKQSLNMSSEKSQSNFGRRPRDSVANFFNQEQDEESVVDVSEQSMDVVQDEIPGVRHTPRGTPRATPRSALRNETRAAALKSPSRGISAASPARALPIRSENSLLRAVVTRAADVASTAQAASRTETPRAASKIATPATVSAVATPLIRRDSYLLTPRMQAFLARNPAGDAPPGLPEDIRRSLLPPPPEIAGASLTSTAAQLAPPSALAARLPFLVPAATPSRRSLATTAVNSVLPVAPVEGRVLPGSSVEPIPAATAEKDALPALAMEDGDGEEFDDDAPVLTRSQMVSDYTLKSTQLSQSVLDFGDTDHEQNILDEEPAIVDASFVRDESEDAAEPVITLNEFLQATGLHFIDGLTTTLRRETSAFVRAAESPSMLDYLKAACLHMPELYSYEHACKAITEHIEEGRQSIRELEIDIAANTPPLFCTYTAGSAEERENLQLLLKMAKSYARSKTKETWYFWREEIFQPFRQAIIQNIESCRKDEKRIADFSTQLKSLIETAQVALDQTGEQIEILKQRQEQGGLPEQVKFVGEQILNKQAEVDKLAQEKARLFEEHDSCRRELASLQSLAQGDKRAHHESYKLLTLTHPWQPQSAGPHAMELAWADRASAVCDAGRRSIGLELNIPVLLIDDCHREQTLRPTVLRTFKLDELAQALNFGTRQICRTRGLLADLEQARSVLPVETLLCDSEGRESGPVLCARVVLVARGSTSASRARAVVSMRFDLGRPLAYPFGGIDCSTTVTYGHF
ncbi:hypothetical protein HK405_002972, partial [Cladochytrium tenue]